VTEQDLTTHLRRVPLFASAANVETSRLGGLTNVNHLVEADGARYVLRIPGAGTSEYIDRTTEEVAARAAAGAGVNAEVVHFDPTDGLMVTRYLAGTVTMDSRRFRDLGAVARAGQVLRRLHDGARPFATEFRLFAMIDEYKALLGSKGATLPDGYEDAERMAVVARRALEARPVALVPSHCDPLCENFLDDGERMFLVDYEYAGNNDPMWDLADLSVEGGFGPEQDLALLAAYFGGEPPRHQVGRMVVYQALCDLLWTLWGVIQHVNGNPVDDFWAYATGRFDRCGQLLSSDGFGAHVDAIGDGGDS
jgi:thiamine kinase-like enzyme